MKNKSANTPLNLLKEIKDRWSPRMFSEEDISDSELLKIFEAARWSASSNNYQPWRFMYARKGSEAYEKIFNCLADFNKQWGRNAPILILTAYKKKTDSGRESFHALYDLGLSVQNLSIQAQYQGIAVHQMGGVSWKKAHEVFEVPEGFHVTTAIAMGYYGGDYNELPDDLANAEIQERTRKPLEEIVRENEFPF